MWLSIFPGRSSSGAFTYFYFYFIFALNLVLHWMEGKVSTLISIKYICFECLSRVTRQVVWLTDVNFWVFGLSDLLGYMAYATG